MNPERQRQHDEAKARDIRLGKRSTPACRAISAPVVKERPRLPRGSRPPKPPPLVEAIDREHEVRVRCVREAYAAEAERHRATFAATMAEMRHREHEDIAELVLYRRELLREARDLEAADACR